MKREEVPSEPPRLVDQDGPVAELLRAARPEYTERLNEPTAFQALERRRERRRRAAGHGLAAAAVVTALVALRLNQSSETAGPIVTAEPVFFRESKAPQPDPASTAVEASDAPTEQPSAARGTPRPDGLRLPSPDPSGAVKAVSAAAVGGGPALSRSASTEEAGASVTDCRLLPAATDAASDAVRMACLRAVAEADGLAAEAALFELIQLVRSRPGQRSEALTLLSEHRRRFPNSALRGEVAELRVRTLYELGRDREALMESEAVLATPSGRVLASKLHLLRGLIYEERLRDCARAATEYVALVGEPGADAEQAELRRARCLERLGRVTDARSAYARYLLRQDARAQAEARARITALRGETPGASPPPEPPPPEPPTE